METIRFTVAGKDHTVGYWSHGSKGRIGGLREIAMRGRRALEGFELARATIKQDARRSDFAKAEDVVAQARERLRELGAAQQTLTVAANSLAAERARLSAVTPYRDGDHATVAIDLALAQHMRSMPAAALNASLRLGADARMLEAALRLPPALTGLTPSLLVEVERHAIERQHPEQAQELAQLAEAVAEAQSCLQRSFGILAKAGGVPLDDRVKDAGQGYSTLLPGVAPVALERISERVNSTDADADADADDDDDDDDEEAARRQFEGVAQNLPQTAGLGPTTV